MVVVAEVSENPDRSVIGWNSRVRAAIGSDLTRDCSEDLPSESTFCFNIHNNLKGKFEHV